MEASEGVVLKMNISSNQCFNGIDDDGDGLMDYPLDPDCASQDDDSESIIVASCTPSVSQITLGQSMNWSVSATGGNGTYTYVWSGADITGDAAQVSVLYPTTGTKNASVTVTAGADSTAVACTPLSVLENNSHIDTPTTPSWNNSSGANTPFIELNNSHPLSLPPSPEKTQNPEDTLDLHSAPEKTDKPLPKKAAPSPTLPIKIKTHTRLTLREGGRIVLTDEPIPVPPRVDNLPLFGLISDLGNVKLDLTNGWLVGKVAPGELLPVSVKLINVSGTKRLDVQLTYSILSMSQEPVYSSSETVAVETTASFVKMVQIPYYLVPGVYNVKVSLTYDGQTVPATSHFPFTVETKIGGIFKTTLFSYAALFIVILLVFIGTYIIIRKKYQQASRSLPIDYSGIPMQNRTFYEIISDTIMDMRQRVGDQAILIANSIDGLKINPESGRVLSISWNPSKIIAELVSKYEAELGRKVSFLFRSNSKK